MIYNALTNIVSLIGTHSSSGIFKFFFLARCIDESWSLRKTGAVPGFGGPVNVFPVWEGQQRNESFPTNIHCGICGVKVEFSGILHVWVGEGGALLPACD